MFPLTLPSWGSPCNFGRALKSRNLWKISKTFRSFTETVGEEFYFPMSPWRFPKAFEGFYHSVSEMWERVLWRRFENTIHVPEERCWGVPSLFVTESSRDHHDCYDTLSEAIPALSGFRDLECCFYVRTTASHWWDWDTDCMSSRHHRIPMPSPKSRNPQITRIKVHRPKKHCKRKRKHGEMRKSAEHRTDVKLRWEMCCYLWQSSKTEFQNATEAARGSNYMFVFFPLFPFRQITLPLSSSLEPKGRAGFCSVIQTMQTVCRI